MSCATLHCFLVPHPPASFPFCPSGQVSCGRQPGWALYGQGQEYTSPNSTVPAPGSKRCLGSRPYRKGGGQLELRKGTLHPLSQFNSSLHEIVQHRKKYSEISRLPSPFHPTQGRPNSTSTKHWTNTLPTGWIPSRIPLSFPLLNKRQD